MKDDSGSYAVFTERGSSATRMTAAKVMDVIAWLRGSADKQPTQYQLTPKENVGRQRFGRVHHDTSGPNVGPTLKNQLFLLSEIYMVTHLPAYCRKDNLKMFCWNMDGRKYQTGNASLCIANKVRPCLCTWMTSNWLEGSKSWSHVEEIGETR